MNKDCQASGGSKISYRGPQLLKEVSEPIISESFCHENDERIWTDRGRASLASFLWVRPPPPIKQKVTKRPKESMNSEFLSKKLFCRLLLSPQPLCDSIQSRFSDEQDLFVWGKCQNNLKNLYLQKQRVEVHF